MTNVYKITLLTFSFIGGIVINKFINIPFNVILLFIILSIVVCSVFKNQTVKSLFAIILFISLGYFDISMEKMEGKIDGRKMNCTAYLAHIVDKQKKIANIVAIKNRQWNYLKLQHKVKLKSSEDVQYGDILLIQGNPKLVCSPINPFVFDYKKFLQDQNIEYQHKLVHYKTIENIPQSSFLPQIESIREKLKKILIRYVKDKQAQGIVLAMLLGFQKNLDKDIQNVYSTTGVIHVLAVSGLHVGIIFCVINFILGFIFVKKSHSIFRLIITLGLLWFYAVLTGFSPSVIRATLMCSIMLLCKFIGKDNQIQSSIFISALFILVTDPQLLYKIGFQLSYCAVIGIVLFQKRIKRLIRIKCKICDYIWNLTSVTLSAQIFTLPLTLYYFQKFPTYFIFSNLIIIPMSTIFVILGIVILLFSPINFLYKAASFILNYILIGINSLMTYISNLPMSSIQNISIDICDVLFLYVLILCLFLYFEKQPYLNFLIFICCFYFIKDSYKEYRVLKQNHIIFYNVKPYWAVSFVKGNKAILCLDKKMENLNNLIQMQICPSFNHYKVLDVEYKFYEDDVVFLNVENKKIGIITNSLKMFHIWADVTMDFVLDCSHVQNISDKLKSNKYFYAYRDNEKQQMIPQIISF